jgi:hypothetical protein
MKKILFLLTFLSASTFLPAQLLVTLGYERNRLDDFRFIVQDTIKGASTSTTYQHQVHYFPTLAVQKQWEGNRYIHRLGVSGLGYGINETVDSKSNLYKGDIRLLTIKKPRKTKGNTLLLGAFMDLSVHRRTTVPKIAKIFENRGSQVAMALGVQPEAQFVLNKNTRLIANFSWTLIQLSQNKGFNSNPKLLPRQQSFSSFDFDAGIPAVSFNVGLLYGLFAK